MSVCVGGWVDVHGSAAELKWATPTSKQAHNAGERGYTYRSWDIRPTQTWESEATAIERWILKEDTRRRSRDVKRRREEIGA